MKKFLYKILAFTLLATIVCGLCSTIWNEPFSWGNKPLHLKASYFLKNKTHYNTLFLGSSRINAQVIPEMFDASVSPQFNIKSYNMGINGMGNPNQYYVYEKLLEQAGNELKYVFIELNHTSYPSDVNLHTTRVKYWYNFEYWRFHIKELLSSQHDLKTKIKGVLNTTLCYSEKLLNIGLISDYFEFKNTTVAPTDNNGYYSFQQLLDD